MRNRLRTFQFKQNSLFVKLMLSFLVLILLLLSFNAATFAFLRSNIYQDTIEYNTLELAMIAENYETQFRTLRENIMSLLLSKSIFNLISQGKEYNFQLVSPAMSQINSLASNHQLWLKDIIIYSPLRSYTVGFGHTYAAEDLFVNILASTTYPANYWDELINESFTYRILPTAVFTSKISVSSSYVVGEYFPIVAKNDLMPSVLLVALVDAQSMYNKLKLNSKTQFLIYDIDGSVIYQSKSSKDVGLNLLKRDSSPIIIGDYYYFYHKVPYTGYTYVRGIPIANINSRLSQLTWMLIVILAISLMFGLVVSAVLSMRFNSPIHRMITSMQNAGSDLSVPSKIPEFNWISNAISEMRVKLNHLSYLNQIKRVHSGKEVLDTDSPYYLVLFNIAYTAALQTLISVEQSKASRYIMEYVNLTLSDEFENVKLIQVEQNQILSLIFTKEPSLIMTTLLRLREVFDRDNEYFLLTIAFHATLRDASDLAEGYEEAVKMLKQRKLSAAPQIITEPAEMNGQGISLTPQQEQELMAMFQSGEAAIAISLITDSLHSLDKRNVSAIQMLDFAKEVVSIAVKSMVLSNIAIDHFMEENYPYQKIQECLNVKELEQYLSDFVHGYFKVIKEYKADLDPIKDFLLLYIQEHYPQDISLKTAANKLNMSSSYLSTYFRERTGITFTDYLNEVRISRAKELLSVRDLRIQEIAEQVGYQSVNSFIRAFKKTVGSAPGEYRKSLLVKRESIS